MWSCTKRAPRAYDRCVTLTPPNANERVEGMRSLGCVRRCAQVWTEAGDAVGKEHQAKALLVHHSRNVGALNW